MSEQSQGSGWWIASDGRWYPPETHPDYRPPSPPPVRDRATQAPVDDLRASRLRSSSLTLVGAGGALILGAFLPWVTATAPFIGTITRSGMEGGDGVFFAGGGLILVLLGFSMRRSADPRRVANFALVVTTLAAALLAVEWSDVSDRVSGATTASELVVASPGSGLYVLGGGVVAGFTGWVLSRKV